MVSGWARLKTLGIDEPVTFRFIQSFNQNENHILYVWTCWHSRTRFQHWIFLVRSNLVACTLTHKNKINRKLIKWRKSSSTRQWDVNRDWIEICEKKYRRIEEKKTKNYSPQFTWKNVKSESDTRSRSSLQPMTRLTLSKNENENMWVTERTHATSEKTKIHPMAPAQWLFYTLYSRGKSFGEEEKNTWRNL